MTNADFTRLIKSEEIKKALEQVQKKDEKKDDEKKGDEKK